MFCQNWSLIFLKKDPKAKIIPLSLFWQNMDKGVKNWLTKIADPLKFMDNILCTRFSSGPSAQLELFTNSESS